jgi:hypothetical protein
MRFKRHPFVEDLDKFLFEGQDCEENKETIELLEPFVDSIFYLKTLYPQTKISVIPLLLNATSEIKVPSRTGPIDFILRDDDCWNCFTWRAVSIVDRFAQLHPEFFGTLYIFNFTKNPRGRKMIEGLSIASKVRYFIDFPPNDIVRHFYNGKTRPVYLKNTFYPTVDKYLIEFHAAGIPCFHCEKWYSERGLGHYYESADIEAAIKLLLDQRTLKTGTFSARF